MSWVTIEGPKGKLRLNADYVGLNVDSYGNLIRDRYYGEIRNTLSFGNNFAASIDLVKAYPLGTVLYWDSRKPTALNLDPPKIHRGKVVGVNQDGANYTVTVEEERPKYLRFLGPKTRVFYVGFEPVPVPDPGIQGTQLEPQIDQITRVNEEAGQCGAFFGSGGFHE